MRNVLPISAGLVVISGIVSATMWHELRSERQVVTDLRAKLTDSNARLQASLAAQRNSVQMAPVAAPVANVTDAKVNSPAPAPVAQPVPANVALQNARDREKEMMADPEYRKARLAQQRMNTERNYPGLAEELGLSQKEADRLFDMLTENQMKMSDELNALFNGGQPDQAARAEITRKQQAVQRQQEEDVAALLGPGKYAQWQGYKETQGGRQQAVQLGTQLAQVGQPLSDVQQRSLTTVLVAEQKRMQQQLQATVRNVNQADPQARLRLREESLKWEEESNRHILDAAAAHLTARQIASLKQQFETQAAMNAAQMRAEQRRMEAQAGQPVPAGARPF